VPGLTRSPRAARQLVHSIAFGSTGAPARRQAATTRDAHDLQRRHARWWDHRNVVGLCIARKLCQGRRGEPCLQVLVRRKMPRGRLDRRHRVPDSVDAPGLGRVLTDVRAVGSGRTQALVSAARPAQPGFNTGHELGGSGTLGLVARDRLTGGAVGISCGHVIARYGRAAPGDLVLVPSLREARDQDVVAEAPLGTLLAVSLVGTGFDDGPTNVDAASFVPDAASDLSDVVAVLGQRPNGIRARVPLDLPVRKVGFMTELTFGEVQATEMVIGLSFPLPGGARTVWFADQVGVSTFTADGDSGALVMDEDGAAVGLHIGRVDGLSVCTPIGRVLDALDCDLP
jgi:hypothetical protein